MSRPFSAVIFDLDGTLIHSLPDLTVAINRLLAEEGRAALAEAEVAPMVGDGAGVLVSRAFDARAACPGRRSSLISRVSSPITNPMPPD